MLASNSATYRDLKDLLQGEIEAIFDAEVRKITKEFKELGRRPRRKPSTSTRI